MSVIEKARAAARLGAKVTDLPKYFNRSTTGGYVIYVDGIELGIVSDDEAEALRAFVKELRQMTMVIKVDGKDRTVVFRNMSVSDVARLSATDIAKEINNQIPEITARASDNGDGIIIG